MADDRLHFEPYVHLAGLGRDRALISWGGFFFRREGDDLRLVDDEALQGRTESIGERSEPYGRADVELRDEAGRVVARVETTTANHVWVEGLEPDTHYRYDIRVDGRRWIEGERYDWIRDGGRASLRPSGREYRCTFRTHPAEHAQVPLTFAVLGDFGIGVFSDSEDSRRQMAIARALERACDTHGVRLVLTTGDNIYLSDVGDDEATGAEDDDWFYSFYQPYRYVLDCVPFYPAVGNHDGAETENSDDRGQLDDNYFLRQRFSEERNATRASTDPGLFYRFEFGGTATFICLDTTMEEKNDARYFADPSHREFLDESFPAGGAGSRWLIPYAHHPVFCAGPEHCNTSGMSTTLVPLFERSGVRLVLAGHEHNFQYSRDGDIHYIVSGAAGKLRTEAPTRFEDARTVSWAAEGHFLVISLDDKRASVHVLTAAPDGSTAPLVARTPNGQPFHTPIVIERTRP